MLAELLYSIACVAGIVAIFNLQQHRHKTARGCRWWAYSFLAIGLAVEMIDAWGDGAPGWGSPRWLTTIGIAVVLGWAAVEDWQRNRSA